MAFEAPEIQPRWIEGRKSPRARSAIANGKKLILADGRSAFAKRYREICSAICRDLGGFENLSQAEISIMQRAAILQVALEAQDAELAKGEKKIDFVTYAQVANGMRRLFETIGIKRVPRDVTLSLADIMRDTQGLS